MQAVSWVPTSYDAARLRSDPKRVNEYYPRVGVLYQMRQQLTKANARTLLRQGPAKKGSLKAFCEELHEIAGVAFNDTNRRYLNAWLSDTDSKTTVTPIVEQEALILFANVLQGFVSEGPVPSKAPSTPVETSPASKTPATASGVFGLGNINNNGFQAGSPTGRRGGVSRQLFGEADESTEEDAFTGGQSQPVGFRTPSSQRSQVTPATSPSSIRELAPAEWKGASPALIKYVGSLEQEIRQLRSLLAE